MLLLVLIERERLEKSRHESIDVLFIFCYFPPFLSLNNNNSKTLYILKIITSIAYTCTYKQHKLWEMHPLDLLS
jgi:hypothetical protein